MKNFINAALKSLTTTIPGILTFLLGIPGVLSALQAWANHQPVNWRDVVISIALSLSGVGLVAAKAGTTHSTPEEVTRAGNHAK